MILRRSIAFLAIFSQILGGTALASDPMDQARALVAASYEVASARALNAATEDFNMALTQTTNRLLDPKDLSQARQLILTEQARLRESFDAIANLRASEIKPLEEQLAKAFAEYQTAVRERYDASYMVRAARDDARESLLMASQAFQVFETNCATGRGVGGLGIGAFSYPDLPKADFRVTVGYGTGDGQSTFEGSYTGTGSQAERDRNTFSNATGTAAGITTSIALSGGAGASVAVAQAMAPFAVGGAVVIAIAVMYINQQERIKAENEIVKAKLHVFHESAGDHTVGQYYKDHCKSMSEQTKLIRGVLDAALTQPEKLESMAAEIPDLDQEVESFRAIVKKREVAFNAAYDAAVVAKNSPSPKTEAVKAAAVKALKDADLELGKAATPQKIANVMVAFLLDQNARVQTQVGNLTFQAVDIAQKRAFDKIQKIVGLVLNKNFRRFLADGSEISIETKSLEKFARARTLFKQVLTAQIRLIFEVVEPIAVRNLENLLVAETNALIQAHAEVSEVADFARQVQTLIGRRL